MISWKVTSSARIGTRGHCDVRGKAECLFKFEELKGLRPTLDCAMHVFRFYSHGCWPRSGVLRAVRGADGVPSAAFTAGFGGVFSGVLL